MGLNKYYFVALQFVNNIYIYIYRVSNHAAPKTCKCELCSHTFATQNDLTTHMVHHSEPKLRCDACHKVYGLRAALIDHLSTHTGDKKHNCICGKSFTYSQGLSNHKSKCRISSQGGKWHMGSPIRNSIDGTQLT